MNNEEKHVSLQELEMLTGVPLSSLSHMRRRGTIPAGYKVGRTRYVPLQASLAALAMNSRVLWGERRKKRR